MRRKCSRQRDKRTSAEKKRNCLRKCGKFNTSGSVELRLQSGMRQSWRGERKVKKKSQSG